MREEMVYQNVCLREEMVYLHVCEKSCLVNRKVLTEYARRNSFLIGQAFSQT